VNSEWGIVNGEQGTPELGTGNREWGMGNGEWGHNRLLLLSPRGWQGARGESWGAGMTKGHTRYGYALGGSCELVHVRAIVGM